jgi:hypothetical protein
MGRPISIRPLDPRSRLAGSDASSATPSRPLLRAGRSRSGRACILTKFSGGSATPVVDWIRQRPRIFSTHSIVGARPAAAWDWASPAPPESSRWQAAGLDGRQTRAREPSSRSISRCPRRPNRSRTNPPPRPGRPGTAIARTRACRSRRARSRHPNPRDHDLAEQTRDDLVETDRPDDSRRGEPPHCGSSTSTPSVVRPGWTLTIFARFHGSAFCLNASG